MRPPPFLKEHVATTRRTCEDGVYRTFTIEKLYVQGFFRGQGIGQNLLSEIINRYGNRFWLYTWVRNKSIEFYKKFGFKDIGQYDFKFGNDTIENRVFTYEQT
jgi:ribosomal protein S18 acetylase RimI-like enzyme